MIADDFGRRGIDRLLAGERLRVLPPHYWTLEVKLAAHSYVNEL